MNKLIHLYVMAAGFFLFWSLIIVISSINDISVEKNNTFALAKREADTTFNKDQAFRYWSSEHGGIYVPISEKTKPNQYLSHIIDRDITSQSGLHLTLMNPAYMIRQIMSDYEKFYGTKGHITSLKTLNKNNEPDAWERAALETFEKSGKREIIEVLGSGSESFLRLMKPMVVEQGCLKCHSNQGYKVGDIRGGVSVKLSLGPYLLLENKTIAEIIKSHAIFWCVGTIALLIFTLWGRRKINDHRLSHEKLLASNDALQHALSEVKTLRGIIPICAYCKKIRDDKGYWNQLESYLHSHSEAEFSHGACPDCFKKMMEKMNLESE
jgi:hypothetical protein